MGVISLILYGVVLLTSLPVGYFLAWLCKDEIIYRKWMFVIFYAFVAGFIWAFILLDNLPVLLCFAYMTIVTAVSIFKGKDKKFLKE